MATTDTTQPETGIDAIDEMPTLPGDFEFAGTDEQPPMKGGDLDAPVPTGPMYVWEREFPEGVRRVGVYEGAGYEAEGYPYAAAEWIEPYDGSPSYWKYTHIAQSWEAAVRAAENDADHRTFILESEPAETYHEWNERTGGTRYERRVPWADRE